MLVRTVGLSLTLLLVGCVPITPDPPTPTVEQDLFPIDLNDVANMMWKLDGQKLDPNLYADEILEIIECTSIDFSNLGGEVGPYFTHGEENAIRWYLAAMLMGMVGEHELEEKFHTSVSNPMHYWLEYSHKICLEID